MAQRASAPAIRFDATPREAGRWTIVRLPEEASARLPSRGQVAVEGTINGYEFQTVVEPDGSRGHWLRVDAKLQKHAAINAGRTAKVEIEPAADWPEPDVPEDFGAALAAASSEVKYLWRTITPMARWEWIRWVNATRSSDTRRRRVEVSMSKLSSGKRRPCCFDLAACTDPDLSKNGRLAEPPV